MPITKQIGLPAWSKGLEKTHADAIRVASDIHAKREAVIRELSARMRDWGVVGNGTLPPDAPSWVPPGAPQIAYDTHLAAARRLIEHAGELRALLEPFEAPPTPIARRARRRG